MTFGPIVSIKLRPFKTYTSVAIGWNVGSRMFFVHAINDGDPVVTQEFRYESQDLQNVVDMTEQNFAETSAETISTLLTISEGKEVRYEG